MTLAGFRCRGSIEIAGVAADAATAEYMDALDQPTPASAPPPHEAPPPPASPPRAARPPAPPPTGDNGAGAIARIGGRGAPPDTPGDLGMRV